MKKFKTKFKGLLLYKTKIYNDKRGNVREAFKKSLLKKNLFLSIVSKSKKKVIRGLHLQIKKPQDKFIGVIKGKILDVVVDDWKSKYISKGKSVPDEADEPMRKHVLSVEFPGTYTEDEGRYFQCEAHAIILGISLDEYLEERKKGDKDIWLNPTK